MFGREKKKLLAHIELLEKRLTELENIHAIIENESRDRHPFSYFEAPADSYDGKVGRYNGRKLNAMEVKRVLCAPHPKTPERRATTKEVRDITFQELASYVVDGTPIVRKDFKPVMYQKTYSPSTVTKSVSTELGNISLTEEKN